MAPASPRRGLLVPLAGAAAASSAAVMAAAVSARSWKREIRRVTRACSAYAELKSRGAASEVEVSLAATRRQLKDFLMGHVELYRQDEEFTWQVFPDYGPGASIERSSPFIRACYGIELLELRAPWGHMLEKISRHPGCLHLTEEHNELEGRCFPAKLCDALDSFQWSGEIGEMLRAYEAGRRVRDSHGKPILRWPHVMMRPMITFKNVRDLPVWGRDEPSVARIMDILEQNVDVIGRELQAMKQAGHFEAAYDHLLGKGQWSRASLYEGYRWSEDRCKTATKTCMLFQNELPGQTAGLPYALSNQEEVVFFYGSPRSHVLPHNGANNGRINIHIGLEGFEGSVVNIWTDVNETDTLEWSSTRAFAFSDGWMHEVVNGPGHRYVLSVGIMHPDIDEASFAIAFNGRTQWMEFEEGELERFRKAHKAKKRRRRALASSAAAAEEL